MKTDRYTKAVLTVIAGALLYIGVMLSGQPLAAQSPAAPFGASQLALAKAQPVVIVGWGTVRGDGEIQITTIKERNGSVRTDPAIPIQFDQTAPVIVSLGVTPEHPLPVGLTAVSPKSEWEPIRTKVEPAPTRSTPGPGGD